MSSRLRSHAGITLAEMLVLLAIIFIFTTLLIPAFQKNREAANTAQCLNNLKRIGTAFQLYANDFDGCLPDSRLSYPNGYPALPTGYAWWNCVQNTQGQRCGWSYALCSYLPNTKALYCPADTSPQSEKTYAGSYQLRYVMTNYMPMYLSLTVKFSMAKRPNRLVYVYETNNWHRNFGYPYIGYPLDPKYGGMPKGKDVGTQYCNALFMDGHVASWPVPARRYNDMMLDPGGTMMYGGYSRHWFYGDVNVDKGVTHDNSGLLSLTDYTQYGVTYHCDPYDVK